jgi:hypothetical protein
MCVARSLYFLRAGSGLGCGASPQDNRLSGGLTEHRRQPLLGATQVHALGYGRQSWLTGLRGKFCKLTGGSQMNHLFRRAGMAFHTSGSAARIGAFMFALGMALACQGFAGQASAARPSQDIAGQSDADINLSLDLLARSLAAAVGGDADLRSAIHNAVSKRFDGDEEALWSSLTVVPEFSATVSGRSQSGATIAGLAAKMPRLQIAVPVNFDSWDPVMYRPLVAYVPEGVDDTKLKSVTAYDAAGHAVQVDAQAGPTQPLIVLGLNERTDEQGKVLPSYAPSARTQQTARSSLTAAAATTYSVDIQIVHLIDDKEPAIKGDAEIAMRAKSRGCSGTDYQATNWETLNNSDDWWAPGPVRNLGLTTCDVVFSWWEDDGGSFDFTLSYGGFSLGTQMDDGDDLIGGKQLPYSSFQGGTNQPDGWPALTMWTQ